MLNPKLKNLRNTKSLRKGINPTIQRAVVTPQKVKQLQAQNTRTQHIENIKRVLAESKKEQETSTSSVAQDKQDSKSKADDKQDSKSKADDKRTWKIVIGVGLGIGIVTAVGYYALKE